jgi:hypothetical protein
LRVTSKWCGWKDPSKNFGDMHPLYSERGLILVCAWDDVDTHPLSWSDVMLIVLRLYRFECMRGNTYTMVRTLRASRNKMGMGAGPGWLDTRYTSDIC